MEKNVGSISKEKTAEQKAIYKVLDTLAKELEELEYTSDDFIERVSLVMGMEVTSDKEMLATASETGHSELYYSLEAFSDRIERVGSKLAKSKNLLEI